MAEPKKLSLRVERFITNWIANGGNASKAAEDAGYSAKSAGKIGHQLLEKTRIKEEIAARIKPELDKGQITIEEIVKKYVALANSNIIKVGTWTKKSFTLKDSKSLTEDEAYSIESIKIVKGQAHVKMRDPIAALDKLAQYRGMGMGEQEDDELAAALKVLEQDEELKRKVVAHSDKKKVKK